MPDGILILGGTGEARQLAALLVGAGCRVTTSLAGATTWPLLPEGEVRVGGFGSGGLERFIGARNIGIIADATHPFAAQMSAKAFAAARNCGIAYVRLERPAWQPAHGDCWRPAKTVDEAVDLLPEGAKVFLTIGRKSIAPFIRRADLSGMIRSIEPVDGALPPGWKALVERPPFSLGHELALLRDHAIGMLVSKNSGGMQTAAKLTAARELQLPVVMIERPQKPEAATASSAEEAAALICCDRLA